MQANEKEINVLLKEFISDIKQKLQRMRAGAADSSISEYEQIIYRFLPNEWSPQAEEILSNLLEQNMIINARMLFSNTQISPEISLTS